MSEARPSLSGPQTEPDIYRYQTLLIRLGLLQGQPGEYVVNASARVLISALHRVLAGGEVRVEVTEPGLEPMYEQLEREFEQFMMVFNDADDESPLPVLTP